MKKIIKTTKKNKKLLIVILLPVLLGISSFLYHSDLSSEEVNPLSAFKSDYKFLNTLWSQNEDGTAVNKNQINYLLSPYIFIVDKQRSKMHLYFYNGKTHYIKSYNVLTGKNKGDKNQLGDLKTPEGIYFFQKYIPGSKLDKKYGSFAITINFPNQIDKIEKKNGYGIWLHGVDESQGVEKKQDTEGCIAASNIDLENMKRFIQPELTPVIIYDSFITDPKKYSAKATEPAINMVNTWLSAWNNKDIDEYMSKYSDNFLDIQNNRNKAIWREYKDFLNKKYPDINVKAENISIYTHPRYTIVQFIQDYKSTYYSSKSLKRLYIEEKDGDYYIVTERSIDLSALRPLFNY
jgi:murein L,D-transpeptidase YafK